MVGGGLGLILVLAFALFTGADPLRLIQDLGMDQQVSAPRPQQGTVAPDDNIRKFVATVLADTEDVWTEAFAKSGRKYVAPRLVLYSGITQVPGGMAQGASGPFYLPADQTVYLDFSFFDQMRQQFGMHGDFAVAYVIAHEVGHHVQHLLGLTDLVHGRRMSETERNQMSVRLELQADFLAGVWAHHAQHRWDMLEEGDIEEAINAAETVGDDRLQKATRGYVVPDSFTHGTAEQRRRWFMKGFQTGRLSGGNAFEVPYGQL
jgi:predicted metalloprotease